MTRAGSAPSDEATQSEERTPGVLVITPSIFTMGEGSGTQTVFETIKGYRRNGFRVVVLALTNQTDARPFEYHGTQVEYFRIPFRLFRNRVDAFHSVYNYRICKNKILNSLTWRFFGLLYFAYGLARALRLVKREQCDLVYCYTSNAIPIGSVVRWLRKIPNVSRILGIRYTHRTLNRFPNQILLSWDYLQYKWPCSLMIMTDDGTEGEETALQMGVSPEKLRFWQNGINIREVNGLDVPAMKRKLGIAEESRVLLSVCRLAPEKRLDLLVNSLPLVLKENRNIHCLIIGSGNEMGPLQRLCEERGCMDYVTFLGSMPNWDIHNYYAIADICVSLSKYGTLVNSTIEALGYGKAAIVANSGDIGEKLSNGHDAVVLSENTPEALATEILRLLADDLLTTALEKNALKTFSNSFLTWEERLDKEVADVRELLTPHS